MHAENKQYKTLDMWSCHYCGAVGRTLTDEHIVPEGLGGRHILRRMSCQRCALITSRQELSVLRGLWGDARKAFSSPRKRQKKWDNKKIIVGKNSYDPRTYPAGFVVYNMPQAGILQNAPDDWDFINQWTIAVTTDKKRDETWEKENNPPQEISFRHHPIEYARMMLKIGYCQVLWDLDPNDFTPLCLDYILEKKDNLSYLVGKAEDNNDKKDVGYLLKTKIREDADGSWLISALVSLLPHSGMPTYETVVGRVTSRERKSSILRKIDAGVSTRLFLIGYPI